MAWHLLRSGGEGEEYGFSHKVFLIDQQSDISNEPTQYGSIAPGSIAHTAGYGSIYEKDASGTWSLMPDSPYSSETGIRDGSVTKAKLANELKLETVNDYITPEMYGAVGDGTTNDTTAVQNAVNAATTAKCKVILSAGKTYLVSTIVLSNGISEISGDGVLKGNTEGAAVLALGGGVYNNTPANGCIVRINIDMSNGAEYGIRGIGVENCSIAGCSIYGFTDSETYSRFGISLEGGSNNNIISGNHISGYENPSHTMAHDGIRIISNTSDYGGYFSESGLADSSNPSMNNLIADNYIEYGESAIILLGNSGTIVTGNHCFKQSTRAIYCANCEHDTIISNNTILGFAASAVLLAYGCHNNIVNGNVIKQISGYNSYAGEAAINIICGCSKNVIAENDIDTMTNYGIYLAVSVTNNTIDNNRVKGYYLAAIAVESDWESEHDAEAIYSKPNYGAPPVGDVWAYGDTEGNIVQNNVIDEGYEGRSPCSLYFSQIGSSAKFKNNTIQNNCLVHPQLTNSWSIRFYEKTPEYMTDNNLLNNSVRDVNVLRQYLTRGRAHFTKCSGNDGIDTAKVSFPTTGSTPSVGKGAYFTCQYSTATNITDFTDGMEGQVIIVNLNANTTIVQAGAKIQLKDWTNATGTSELSFIVFKRIYNVWIEIARNF